MPVIGQKSFLLPPTTDTYLQLADEEFVRQFDLGGIGNNWTKLRVSMQFALADAGGNMPNAGLFLGFCSGTSLPFGAKFTTHAVGYVWGSPNTAQTYTYVANSGNSYYSGASYYGVRKVNGAVETATIGSTSWCLTTNAGVRRGWISASVIQAPTSVKMAGNTINPTSAAVDIDLEEAMYANTQSGATPYLNGYVGGANDQTFAESAGWNSNPLNCVDIYWRSAVNPIYIYSLVVSIVP